MPMTATTGPTPEWIERYKEMTKPQDGFMSIAPAPEFAWACEQILGSWQPDVVIPVIQEDGDDYRRVRTLHESVVSLRDGRSAN